MEAAVDEDGQHDQQVGEDDDEAHQHAQAHDDVVPSTPVVADVLAALFVEELDRAVVVATADVLPSPVHQHDVMEGGKAELREMGLRRGESGPGRPCGGRSDLRKGRV